MSKKEQFFSTNFRYIPSALEGISDVLVFYDEFSRKRWKISFHQDEYWIQTVSKSVSNNKGDYIVGIVRTDDKDKTKKEMCFAIYQGNKKIEWLKRSVDLENILE